LPETLGPPSVTAVGDKAAKEAVPAPKEAAPATVVVPGPACDACAAGCDGSSSVFGAVPPVQAIARPGFFFMPPQGPGYYSLWDMVTGQYRQDRPPQPYGPASIMLFSLYDANFHYLDNPDADLLSPFDALKRMHLGDDFLLSVGGEERLRSLNEVNSRLSGKDNNYQLMRSRVYGDLWYEDKVRVYVEFLQADSFNQNLAPGPYDRDHGDILNAFIDLKLLELDDAPVYVRGGRQEMYYGSQRLISALDWANDRRTFDGVKMFRHTENFDADIFWVEPVIPNVSKFDEGDSKRNFSGAWLTYRPMKGQAIDLYYLNLDIAQHDLTTTPVTGAGGVRGSADLSTIGSRYAGNYQNVMFDFEGMYQFGPWSNQITSATAYTTALGYNFADVPMTPQFWLSWDYASGNHNPGTTDIHGTFNELFPFNHYYNFLDLVGRQNIEDLQAQFVFWPAKWITSSVQYHIFRLDSAKDALYNSAGVPIRQDKTGKDGTDVGNELDLTTNFHLSQNQDVFIGWSKLYQGSFLKKTGYGPSPELFYAQYSFRW